jgi:general secretion pathway protein D
VIKTGNLYRVMPESDARVASPIGGNGAARPLPAELMTRVIPLQQSSAVELGNFLPDMLGDQGSVAVYAPSNTLIVTTSTALMQKVLTIVNEVDQGLNQPSFRSFTLQHANARIAAEQVNRMLQSRARLGESAGQSSFAVVEGDDRTGRIVVVADPESMRIIERSIASFDLPTAPGKGDIRVIPLKFASAEELATVITNVVTNQSPRGGYTSSSDAGGQAERVLVSEVSVVADKASNSLLVAASPRDFDTIRELVQQLDIERRQVYVEAMIVEVSTDTVRNMGINWTIGGTGSVARTDYLVFGGARPGGPALTGQSVGEDGNMTLLNLPAGGSIGVLSHAPLRFGDFIFSQFNFLANFMRTDSRFHILATPQLMTLDNEEATVVVAENIPFLTQSAVGASTTDRIVQNVDYRDVGITLNILPQVSSNGNINLKVQQIVSRVASQGIISDGQVLAMPTTRRREVNTRVVLEDGQTLVIAGLIASDTNDTINKIPGLGDIPGFGWFFKSKEDQVTDTNLLLFITPRVILNREEALTLEASKRQILFRIETGDDGRLTAARLPMRTLSPRLESAR